VVGVAKVLEDPVDVACEVGTGLGVRLVDLKVGIVDDEDGLLASWLERERVLTTD
jgi:hypothetical protein